MCSHYTAGPGAFPFTTRSVVTLFSGGLAFANFSGSAALSGTQVAPAPVSTVGYGAGIVAVPEGDGPSDTVTVTVSVTLASLRNQTAARLQAGCT